MRRHLGKLLRVQSVLWLILLTALVALPVAIAGAMSASTCQAKCAPLTMKLHQKHEGGAIQLHPQTYALFWGPWWQTAQGKFESAHVVALLGALHGSSYAKVLSQYYEVPEGGHGRAYVSSDLRFLGSFTDASVPMSKRIDFTKHSDIIKAASVVAGEELHAHNITTTEDTSVLVFTETGPSRAAGQSQLSNNNHCLGIHEVEEVAKGEAVAVSVIWSRYFKTSKACNTEGATVTATHEWAETITDPEQRGWMDKRKQEIGDDCAASPSLTMNIPRAGESPFLAYVTPLWSIVGKRCE